MVDCQGVNGIRSIKKNQNKIFIELFSLKIEIFLENIFIQDILNKKVFAERKFL